MASSSKSFELHKHQREVLEALEVEATRVICAGVTVGGWLLVSVCDGVTTVRPLTDEEHRKLVVFGGDSKQATFPPRLDKHPADAAAIRRRNILGPKKGRW